MHQHRLACLGDTPEQVLRSRDSIRSDPAAYASQIAPTLPRPAHLAARQPRQCKEEDRGWFPGDVDVTRQKSSYAPTFSWEMKAANRPPLCINRVAARAHVGARVQLQCSSGLRTALKEGTHAAFEFFEVEWLRKVMVRAIRIACFSVSGVPNAVIKIT